MLTELNVHSVFFRLTICHSGNRSSPLRFEVIGEVCMHIHMFSFMHTHADTGTPDLLHSYVFDLEYLDIVSEMFALSPLFLLTNL